MLSSYLYTSIQILSRFANRIGCHLQLSHLRAKGATIGKNVTFKRGVRITLAKGGQLHIGDDVLIDRNTDIVVHSTGKLTVGNRVYIGRRNTISAKEEVVIGENSLFAHNVTVLDTQHRYNIPNVPIRDQGDIATSIHIGEDVWLATSVVVLAGVTLKPRTIVAANSVVTKSFTGNLILGGVPALTINEI